MSLHTKQVDEDDVAEIIEYDLKNIRGAIEKGEKVDILAKDNNSVKYRAKLVKNEKDENKNNENEQVSKNVKEIGRVKIVKSPKSTMTKIKEGINNLGKSVKKFFTT